MLKNILYAILLGAGMAACLEDRDGQEETVFTDTLEPEATEAQILPQPDPTHFVLAKGRVGSIHIGMPIEEMRQQVPAGQQIKDTTLQLEGQQYTAYVFSSPESPSGLLVEQLCEPDCKVWRLSVRNNDYKTAQGIGLGSKYSEVAQHYPISYTSMGEAGFVAVSEQAGMSFVLDTHQLDQNRLHVLQPDQIPANTLVRGILIY